MMVSAEIVCMNVCVFVKRDKVVYTFPYRQLSKINAKLIFYQIKDCLKWLSTISGTYCKNA